MPTRVFSNEDGNLNKTTIAVARTRIDQDIDLSFAAKFFEEKLVKYNIC